jgi:hypothetical protein
MQITSVEMKDDLSSCGLEYSNLSAIGPLAHKPPLVQSRMIRLGIEVFGIMFDTARRRKIFGAVIADVGLRRADIVHVSGGFNPLPVHIHGTGRHWLRIRLFQQFLYPTFGLVIRAFAEVLVAHLFFCVDKVVGWPIFVVERIPDRLIIDHDDLQKIAVNEVHERVHGPQDVYSEARNLEDIGVRFNTEMAQFAHNMAAIGNMDFKTKSNINNLNFATKLFQGKGP